jgi:hypothetical protein
VDVSPDAYRLETHELTSSPFAESERLLAHFQELVREALA